MLRWLLKLVFLIALGFGFYHVAFVAAPERCIILLFSKFNCKKESPKKVRINGVPDEIRTGNLPNKRLQRYRNTNLLKTKDNLGET